MAFLSPSVFVRELDFSDYIPRLSTTICAMLGGATKGPVNDPTLITSEGALIDTFGFPLTTDYGLQSALQFLRNGNQLIYVRVADTNVNTAEITVEDATTADVYKILAASPGSWSNGMIVTQAAGTNQGIKLSVQATLDSAGNTDIVEVWDDLILNDANDPRYIETVINDGVTGETNESQYIRIDVLDGSLTPVDGPYTLAGGDDGVGALADADYTGVVTGQSRTGLKTISDPESVDINILAIPGVTSAAVVTEIAAFCETRRDCLGLIDPPFGLGVSEVIDYHNGVGYGHDAFNSSYTAFYWPWVEVYDGYNRRNIFLPPSGFQAGQFAFNDLVAEAWFAAAGFNRGQLRTALRLETSPDLGERDALYGNGNAVNPIVDFAGQGITVWGNRTTQRRPTALDRVNVRRMLLYLEKSIASVVKYLVFEPNDPVTWKRFTNIVRPFLEDVRNRRGLIDFRVICDESTNPPIKIDQGIMTGKILVKPTKAAEFIQVDFVILATGAEFAEFGG